MKIVRIAVAALMFAMGFVFFFGSTNAACGVHAQPEVGLAGVVSVGCIGVIIFAYWLVARLKAARVFLSIANVLIILGCARIVFVLPLLLSASGVVERGCAIFGIAQTILLLLLAPLLRLWQLPAITAGGITDDAGS